MLTSGPLCEFIALLSPGALAVVASTLPEGPIAQLVAAKASIELDHRNLLAPAAHQQGSADHG